jgi:thymidylate kinase
MTRARLVYFAGLDGSGKTTQAERLVAARSESGQRWTYRWVRWEPWLTRPFMSIARRVLRGGGTSERPEDDTGHAEFVAGKRAVFRQKWRRDLWTALVLLEYLPQMAWRLLPALRRGGTVVCDRYVPDLWIDLAMNFGEGVEGVDRLAQHPLSRLFPAVDHLVLLELPARVGFERKRDGTPLAYLEEREPFYRHLAGMYPATVVDASASLEAVADEVAARVPRGD